MSSRSRLTSDETMERVSVRVTSARLEAIEAAVERGEYFNKSEALRAALRSEFSGGDDDE